MFAKIEMYCYIQLYATLICLSTIFISTCFYEAMDEISSIESLQHDFGTIKVATYNFSDSNKLGQGGFGVVYEVREY